jgi:hypothetical protein
MKFQALPGSSKRDDAEGSSARSRSRAPWAIALVVLPAVVCVGEARAEGEPYCEKVRARASADAALLMSPRLYVQGIKFPSSGQIDVGVTSGAGYQLRTGLAFSPLDFYRGVDTLRVADADCDQHDAEEAVRTLLSEGIARARVTALRAEVAYLEGRGAQWRGLFDEAATRLSERVITLVEFDSLRRSVGALEHKLVQAEGEANQIAASSTPLPPTPLSALDRSYSERAMRFERAQSALRSLGAWQFQFNGGVIPVAPVDWYGVAEVSFILGDVVRSHQEQRYLEARKEELAHANYEIESETRRFRAQVVSAIDEARRDLAIVEHDVTVLASTREILEKSDAQNIIQARDTLTVQQIAEEADGAFLRADLAALAMLLEDAHGQ